jgi:hypothetical protein
MMNTAIEILDNVRHQQLKIDFDAARRSARSQLVPVVLSEFHSLMFHYPLVLVKDGDTGEFICSALLSINAEANLLHLQDLSRDEGVPLNVRRLPLVTVAPAEGDENKQPLIAINRLSAGIGQGDYIFNKKSAAFDSAIAALAELYEGYDKTKAYVKTLIELDLIGKLNAEIRYKDKPGQILEGLYGIDINKVTQLRERDDKSTDLFLDVASYAYAQYFSLHNMRRFAPFVS